MTTQVYTKQYKTPDLNENEILRYAGARGDSRELKAMLGPLCDRILPLLSYKVCYSVLPVEFDGGLKLLGYDFSSRFLEEKLRGASYAILFCATVGHGIDREISRLALTSPTSALLAGAIGSERAESLCDAFCQSIARAEGLAAEIAPRYSAGYADIPLTYQKTIFEILEPEGRIGVTLRDSLLMSPSKTVTALVPLSVSPEKLSEFHLRLSEY